MAQSENPRPDLDLDGWVWPHSRQPQQYWTAAKTDAKALGEDDPAWIVLRNNKYWVTGNSRTAKGNPRTPWAEKRIAGPFLTLEAAAKFLHTAQTLLC